MNKQLTIVTTTFRAEKYLNNYFSGILSLDGKDTFQFILVMNEPNEEERKIAFSFYERDPDLIRIVEVPHRETIGASLNRGFALVNTPYCSYLDADDVRVSDSYLKQIDTLEKNRNIDYTYGDYIIVDEYGSTSGEYVQKPDFHRADFIRESRVSPTHLFRSSLINKIGGFDEQFKVCTDFEFQVRAVFNCLFKKTPGLLLYYTKYPNSDSASSNSSRLMVEHVMILLRYGVYDKIMDRNYYNYIRMAQKYRLDHVLLNNQWIPLERHVPGYPNILSIFNNADYFEYRKKYRNWLTRYYLNTPDRLFRKLFRIVLNKLGLLYSVRKLRGLDPEIEMKIVSK
jgi:hypothetical protein